MTDETEKPATPAPAVPVKRGWSSLFRHLGSLLLFSLVFFTCVATGRCTCGGRDYVGDMIDIHRMEQNR